MFCQRLQRLKTEHRIVFELRHIGLYMHQTLDSQTSACQSEHSRMILVLGYHLLHMDDSRYRPNKFACNSIVHFQAALGLNPWYLCRLHCHHIPRLKSFQTSDFILTLTFTQEHNTKFLLSAVRIFTLHASIQILFYPDILPGLLLMAPTTDPAPIRLRGW